MRVTRIYAALIPAETLRVIPQKRLIEVNYPSGRVQASDILFG